MLTSQIILDINVHHLLICVLCRMYFVLLYYCLITTATVRACHIPCCPVLLSLYCIVIGSLNEINGDGDKTMLHAENKATNRTCTS